MKNDIPEIKPGVFSCSVPVPSKYEMLEEWLRDKKNTDTEKIVNAVRNVMEMDPIVLPMDAAWMFGDGLAVWPEIKTEDGTAHLIPPCMLSITIDDANGGYLVGLGQHMHMHPHRYGKDYRVWLGRKPTDKERTEVPWE